MLEDQLTQARFGYAATDLSPKSTKRVMVRCPQCQNVYDRFRFSIHDKWVCKACHCRTAHTRTPKPVPADLPIDVEATLRELGYPASSVGEGSSRKVIVRCTACDRPFAKVRGHVTPTTKCRSCATTLRWRARNKGVESIVLPEDLDDAATLARFGYTATSLWAASTRYVVARCRRCKLTFERRRRDINRQIHCRPCSLVQAKATVVERFGEQPYPRIWSRPTKVGTEIRELLEGWGVGEVVTERPLASGKRIDFVVPARGVAIEFNGLYFHHEHSPVPRPRAYHRQKWLEVKALGLRLLNIFEDEWVYRRHAVEGVLKAALGVYSVKTAARRCALREIPTAAAREFMDREHLQGGSARARRAWGLFYQDRLVAAATLAAHHRQADGNVLVMDRLCFANGVHVVGGAGRLVKVLLDAARAEGAVKVLTWSDNRWTDGDVYPRVGFVKEADLPPDYCYVHVRNPDRRLSKQSQKKSATGCPPDVTERDWALKHGLARIWDCGHVRWAACP